MTIVKDYGQQGDVILRRIKSIPEDATKKHPEEKVYILAAGEHTGHHHCVNTLTVQELTKEDKNYNIEMYEKDGVSYLSVSKDTAITHEEHNPVTVSSGVWEIGIVREYDPFAEEAERVREVMD